MRSDRTPALSRPMEQALDWFLRLKEAGVGEPDRRAFDAWRAADPSHAGAYRAVVAMWESPEFTASVVRHGQAACEVVDPRKIRPWKRYAAIAACALLAVGLMNLTAIRVAWQSDHRTGVGERERLSFSDGSTAVLNSGSAVALQFTPEARRVELLKGETYVDVSKDPRRTFELAGGEAVARVVGTGFSMRREFDASIVTVHHGEVAVRRSGEEQEEIHLHAGDLVRVTSRGMEPVRRVDPGDAFAWVEGRIRFHDQPLGDVLAELDRHHSGVILVTDPRLKAIRVSGNYRLDNPAAVVASLADATHARVVNISSYVIILH